MARRRPRRAASSSSDDDNPTDKLFRTNTSSEPDCGYETELTDPDWSPPRAGCEGRKHQWQQQQQSHRSRQASAVKHDAEDRIDLSLYGSLDEDPPDDTDENLSDVPSDYGGSKHTRKKKLRAKTYWARYCGRKALEPAAAPRWSDPAEAIRAATANDVHRFFNWILGKLKRGQGGRRLKGFKKADSLETEWKYLHNHYVKMTGEPMSDKMRDDIRRGMRSLIDKYKLDDQVRDNTPVYIEDMIPFNETILSTREKRFHLGIQRLLLCFYNMLGLFTVNREHAILNLQYKDLLLTVQRDPHGGPPVPMVDFTPRCVKKKMGMKNLNSFILPEIIYGISLVFSPHVFLFGFLFHANAFENPSLRSMEDVRRLFPEDGCQEMPLPLKHEMMDCYVFCKVDVVDGEARILRDTPMTAGALDSQMKSLSEIHGFLNPFYSHQFRYGGGKLLDESGFVSEAQRNVIMNHASSRTFIRHYRVRQHSGLQEIMCGLDPDEEWGRAVTRMSRYRDKRRPRHLSDAERASAEEDPELQAAIHVHESLADLYRRTQDPALIPLLSRRQQEVTNTRRRLQDRLKHVLRQDFSRKQAVIDIERQLSGSAVNDEHSQQVPRREFEMPPAQIHLLENLLTWPTSDSLEDEWQRRNKGVGAVTEYCDFPEGGPLRGRPPKRRLSPEEAPQKVGSPAKKARLEDQPTISRQEEKNQAIEKDTPTVSEPEKCFQCPKKVS
ncbi:predicted protein [Histoplasma mississippiense (nom. inval.)]|uniref:predicted protein n=1 Tax=Ajellomyces capsulatus (strain NAm1 / WU24) TaxID=2059318 RepID=UPI000157C235|nr:predicted protein [Histoplasma mississippiense (nom. inval.)]EDN07394.1 predicted protein [Histoplasma mississippiense (nom. inval.)]